MSDLEIEVTTLEPIRPRISPQICALKARVVDEILGVIPKTVKTLVTSNKTLLKSKRGGPGAASPYIRYAQSEVS